MQLEPTKEQPNIVQVQVGNSPRSAARDYRETHIHWSMTKHWELTASGEELNDCALKNENFFKRRFGFEAAREQRRDIIALKCHLDLTDRDVSRLKVAGALTIGKGKLTTLCADRLLVAFGVFCLSVSLIWGTVLGAGLLFSDLPPIKQLLGLTVIGSLTFPLIWASSALSVWPLLIIRRRGLQLGQKWVLREHVPILLPSSE
jgi:hypothetical protein